MNWSLINIPSDIHTDLWFTVLFMFLLGFSIQLLNYKWKIKRKMQRRTSVSSKLRRKVSPLHQEEMIQE